MLLKMLTVISEIFKSAERDRHFSLMALQMDNPKDIWNHDLCQHLHLIEINDVNLQYL